MKRLLLILCTILSGFSLWANESKLGAWYNYFGNQAINKNWNWHNEIQYRNFNLGGDLDQLLIRTGIGYNLTPNNNNILLGYGFIYNNPYVKGSDEKYSFSEHRIFQQYITKQQFGRVYLQHRYRVEERFLQDDFKIRFRYHFSVNIPINKKAMGPKALYVSAYNELFINGQKSIYDRNRLYGALGYCLSKELKFEVGFMRQVTEQKGTNQMQLAFYNNLPFKRDS
ncbi:DUF2490 domain-containing protein [Taibaiella sp. KBW10]|uniref:DUF2490 domain-containing protein n=1 Tax=Taibaiella sp. KBW10 TaxID=2153357 RepID=UPI000F59A404|nr:DUF2490 domain-containing protein [Taibaiella sp. KBW10]RQO30299.1 DUF2490 domain-containing protein [Taibaiella sp. KBW10]